MQQIKGSLSPVGYMVVVFMSSLRGLGFVPLLRMMGLTPRFFIVSVGISYSLIGLFIFLIAKIMELVRSLKEEQDLTI